MRKTRWPRGECNISRTTSVRCCGAGGRIAVGGIAGLHAGFEHRRRDSREGDRSGAEAQLRPNSIASSLTTKRTNIVALILGNLANPFYVLALHEFSRKLQACGRQVLIFTVEPGAESDEAIMRALQYQIDGVILTSAQLSTRMTAICHERGIPIVLFNRYIPSKRRLRRSL